MDLLSPWLRLLVLGKCIKDCNVHDMGMSGPFFTWSNKQEGVNRVFSKIDSKLCNDEWYHMFEAANAMLLREGNSNHSPAIIMLDSARILQGLSNIVTCGDWQMIF